MFTKTFVSFAESWDLNIPRIEESMLRGMKPGKILRREILAVRPDYKQPDWLKYLDNVIQEGLAALYADQYVPEVKFAYSREAIEEIYADENCPSCMTDLWAAEVAGQFYNANGFVVAYRHNGKNVTARCVTFGKTFSETYGPENMKLWSGLNELGYKNMHEARLFQPWTRYTVPYINENFYVPYLDSPDGFSGCFIPVVGGHNSKNSTWECLLLPMAIDDGINDLEELPMLEDVKMGIEDGKYLDVLIEGQQHGRACEQHGALHTINQHMFISEEC